MREGNYLTPNPSPSKRRGEMVKTNKNHRINSNNNITA